MQINQEELRRRLLSTKNLAVSLPDSGGDSNVNESQGPAIPVQAPEKPRKPCIETKIVAGSLASQGESPSQIAREFGLSTSQVNSAKNSYNPKIRGPIQSSLERVQELAIEKLMLALGLMTSDKFETANLKDLSIITANLSRVIEKTTEHNDAAASFQLIIYAPEQRTERSYRVIDV